MLKRLARNQYPERNQWPDAIWVYLRKIFLVLSYPDSNEIINGIFKTQDRGVSNVTAMSTVAKMEYFAVMLSLLKMWNVK